MRIAVHRRVRVVWAGLVLLVAAGCGGSDAPPSGEGAAADRTPLQLVLVFDRSTSITLEELELYDRLAAQKLNELSHGDRVAAIELLQLSLEETPHRWAQRVPEREFQNREMQRDSVSRARFVQDARDYLRRFTAPEDRDNFMGTDILSTLFDVAEEVRAFPNHRTTVVLFSDMLQATQEMNMEGLIRMPPANWISQRAAQDRLPDLSGACVVVVGARTDTAAGQQVKEFWEEYFEATGATFLDRNYSYRPVQIPADPCPGMR
jgi:hypothetical protein